MSARKVVRNRGGEKASAGAPGTVVQNALQVTWLLKGNLKNAQIAYIRVGILLARVRDEQLYTALGHADMNDYAEKRLHLGQASLYRYLQVHDWMSARHPEWLQPKPKGFIPELTDAADLIWIESELARKDIDPKKRAALEALRRKAMDGRLREGELNRWRRRGHTTEESLKSFLSKLRRLRMRGAQLASMPPEAVAHLDAAIGILKNAVTLQLAGIDRFSDTELRRTA